MRNSGKPRFMRAMLQLFAESVAMVGVTALVVGTVELAVPYPLVVLATIVVATTAAYLSVFRIYGVWRGAYLITDLHVWLVALSQSAASLGVLALVCSSSWRTHCLGCSSNYQRFVDYRGYVGASGVIFLMMTTLMVWGWCRYQEWKAGRR